MLLKDQEDIIKDITNVFKVIKFHIIFMITAAHRDLERISSLVNCDMIFKLHN